MAKKKNALVKWMGRMTQQQLSEFTGIGQSSISDHCRGLKVSDYCICLYKDTQEVTGIPDEVLDAISVQHLQ